MLMICRYW